LAVAAVPSLTAAQPPAPKSVLDVPYLPQSEALCGGAAVAMVMRYWGEAGVYAETFADLVDAQAGGIRGGDLLAALEGRGFTAVTVSGDPARVRAALGKGIPTIALVEDRPGRFHYVVVVGWFDDRVVLHDPARAPFRVIDQDAFLNAWGASGNWTLFAQPQPQRLSRRLAMGTTQHAVTSAGAGVCHGLIEEGIRLAGIVDLTAAQRVLDLAKVECGRDPGPWRELAGVNALKGEWGEAVQNARHAIERDPNDAHAIRILATGLFLEGQEDAALDAWNRLREPLVDLASVTGLTRTRFAVASEAIDLPAETILTRERLARARRRLAAVPAFMGSRVSYEPGEDGLAQVDAGVLERPLLPTAPLQLAATGLRAATDREVVLRVASPSGGGELWTGSWRWWENRPRGSVGLSAPSAYGGIWSVEGFGERQTYGFSDAQISERRRGVLLSAADWITGTIRIGGGLAFDRWDSGGTGSVLGGVARSFGSSHGIVAVDGQVMAGIHRAAVVNAGAEWKSTVERTGSGWLLRGGFSAATARAPLALWPGAGTGQGRDPLVRAHPLLHDGVIRGVFGRRLAHGSAEWRLWRGPVFKVVRVAPAAFVDLARAFNPPAFGDGRAHVDVGAGLRIAVPGAGVLRVDLAKGLRDGATALWFGWGR
jgi:hypothetical protein